MVILSIDTSTYSGSVAVTQEFQILSQKNITGPLPFSQILLHTVDNCLKEAGVEVSGIDAFAVARGPGSFTGLRLGVALINGLALATGRPAIGVDTLHAMAFLAPRTERTICPLLDARKNEIYGATFLYDGEKLTRTADDVVEPLEDFLQKLQGKTLFLGNGAEIHRGKIKNFLKDQAFFDTMDPQRPVAAGVGFLAWGLLKQNAGQGGDAPIIPLYIRRCEAEVKINYSASVI